LAFHPADGRDATKKSVSVTISICLTPRGNDWNPGNVSIIDFMFTNVQSTIVHPIDGESPATPQPSFVM